MQKLCFADLSTCSTVRDKICTETVHLAPVGGRRASPYNVWIHWLQKEEPDQFAKRGKADFQLQVLLKTAQWTMKTFKLGYQAPMKDVCAECELYNPQIRSAPPALEVAMFRRRARSLFLFEVCGAPPPPPTTIFRPNCGTSRPHIYDRPANNMTATSTMDSTALFGSAPHNCGVDTVMVWPEYVAGKGFNEMACALIGELYRCSTRAGHLFIHTDGF